MDGSQSWGGLGITEVGTPEFQDVLKYYYDVVDAVAADSLPDAGRQLLRTLKDDPDAYLRTLCTNNFSASVYYNVPVLATIPPEDFASHVLDLNPESQRTAFSTFKARYESGLLSSDLANEKAWLPAVKKAFEEKAKTLRPMSRYRLLNYIGHNIAPFL